VRLNYGDEETENDNEADRSDAATREAKAAQVCRVLAWTPV